MKKETIWIVLVILLIGLNATILFLFLGRETPGRPGPGDQPPRDRQIINALSLDENQQAKFAILKEEHRDQIKELNSKANEMLELYFMLLESSEIDLAQKDSLESEFASIERAKMKATFDHFRKLKSICNPAQQKEFDEFLPKLIELVMPPRQEKSGPPRRN
ncbi:MAG: Spy/CpxP family protein refolding chaperone [Algoriphagus sp.]|nr:Spy/CpxP family protein refolding chaperone [Algoriphagus sp.]